MACLRNGHKVADDTLVRHRNRSAVQDLTLEKRNHRAGTSEHIAEARRAECRVIRSLAVALHDHLTHPFGCTHDVGRINRFIRGHHHKALDTVFLRKFYCIEGAEHIVLNRLTAIMLHQRNVLVRRRMNDNLRTIPIKNSFQCRTVTYRKDFNTNIEIIFVCNLQFLLNIVHAVFIDVKKYELLRKHLRHLPAELTADTSSTARDQDYLVTVISSRLFVRHHDRLTEKQFFHVEFSKVALGFTRLLHGRVIIYLDFATERFVLFVQFFLFFG